MKKEVRLRIITLAPGGEVGGCGVGGGVGGWWL